jgi:hypothetical protein
MLEAMCALCDFYGMPFTRGNWNKVYINSIDRFPYPWNSQKLLIPKSAPIVLKWSDVVSLQEAVEILCHELAHWIKATEEERSSPSFGLPFADELSKLSEAQQLYFSDKEKEVIAVTQDLLRYIGLVS